MHLQSDVCIVGNGVIGKVAALGLAQAGQNVTLLAPPPVVRDSAPQPDWDVRVYALNHLARDLLVGMRVWDALDASRVAPVDAMDVNGDGAQAGRLMFDAYGARAGALAWIVEDSNLNQAIDAALRFAPNVRIVSGRALALQCDAIMARVTLESGATLQASLVIGADGAQSWVRNQADIGIDYRPYHQQAVVANFDCDKPHHGVAYQWFAGTEGVIALLPLPGQRVSLVWSAPNTLAEALLRDASTQLPRRLAAWAFAPLGELRLLQPETVKALPLALVRAHAVTAPRVALIGDAAHVVHPLAGQGMNLGFGDVAALLDTISTREPQRDCGDARVLARYARARKEEILLMHMATDGLARLFGAESEPVRVARNLGLSLVSKLPFLKQRLVMHALGKR
jgi:2-octaprenylphenol hydroxylase